ncbi:MAG TPA: HAMP domain-containing sensor histidine kinase [Gaiellaceae bacterium]|nr:HAMP domain-containing sensor histidine kinase [Gaiellaceae bacterium]
MRRDFRLCAGVLSAELVLSGIYFLFPSAGIVQYTLYEVFGGGCVVAILWAIRRYRPQPRLPWLVFAAGTALFVAGDIVFDVYPNWSQPGPADYLYLIAYPLWAATAVMLVISSGSHRRLGALTDAAIVTLAFAVFEWIFVAQPTIDMSGPLGQQIVVGGLYPLMDIVLLGAFAGFFVSPAWRTPAFGFLVLGAASQLMGDVANGINAGAYSGGNWIDWPWMASYIFWTAAVLHPSMRELTEPGTVPETRVGRWRLAALAGALLTVPVARLVADLDGKPVGIWVLAGLSAAIGLLVVTRMYAIVHSVDRIRRQLAERNVELVEADRLKDEFIALVSHDLRTPLTSIIGYVELALDDAGEAPLDAERRRYIEVVARSSDRLLRLVDDLLLAARLQSGRFVLNFDETDLESVAAEALDEMHARAERKGVSVFLASDGPVRVECDRRRVLQLLDNLVSNAVKFTPEGGRVEVRVERTLDGAAVEILDTGVGIGTGEEERIFDRFYRSPSAVSDQVPGTGLGLFIARAIADRHGGTIAVRRRDGGGSIFRLELPAHATSRSTEPELVA